MLDYDLVPARTPPPAGAKAYHCLILHGLGDSMEGWKPVAPMLGLDRLGFAFANAPIPYHGGFSWFDLQQPDMLPDLGQVRQSRAQLNALIDQLLAKLGIPSQQLFVLGFSQGALMTIDAGLRSPHRFAGLVGISGFMCLLEEFPAAFGAAATSQDLLLTHGLYDDLIPIDLVREQKAELERLGLKPQWCEYDKAHTVDPEHELADLRFWLEARMAPQRRRA